MDVVSDLPHSRQPLPSRQQQLRWVMQAYVLCYACFFACVLLAEDRVYDLLEFNRSLLGFGAPAGPAPAIAVWKYVALGYIASLGLFSWWAQLDLARHRVFIQLMVYGKFLAAALMIGHFAAAGGVTAFLLSGLSDAAMGLLALAAVERAFPGSAKAMLAFRPLGPA